MRGTVVAPAARSARRLMTRKWIMHHMTGAKHTISAHQSLLAPELSYYAVVAPQRLEWVWTAVAGFPYPDAVV